jgi:hypothetical protein
LEEVDEVDFGNDFAYSLADSLGCTLQKQESADLAGFYLLSLPASLLRESG